MSSVILMNSCGVSFATDSAHAINRNNNFLKTTPTANKIYRLCADSKSPIAIILCDNRDFNGVPLELIILDFRRENPGPWKSVDDCKSAFLEYLRYSRIDPQEYDEFFILNDAIDTVDNMVERHYKSGSPEEFIKTLKETQKKKITPWVCLQSPIRISKKQKEKIKEAVYNKCHMFPREFRDEIANLLFSVAIKFFSKEYPLYGSSHIGFNFVACGYGTQEYLPTLIHSRVVGTVNRNLLYLDVQQETISSTNSAAVCCVGDGRDTMEMILFGSSERNAKWHNGLLNNQKKALQAFFTGDNSEASTKIDMVFDHMHRAIENRSKGERNRSRSVLKNYTLADLARFSKMLVETAAFKQQLQHGIESIGGPTDVAVISKTDGFQWYARKLYFDPSINTQMFGK